MARAKKVETEGLVEVRILQNCPLGKVNDVIELDAVLVEALKQDGLIDDDKAAVEYAKGL